MTRKRRTSADRVRERAEAERRIWDAFYPRLNTLQTFEEGLQLYSETPRPDAPGRRYYSNLGFFLQNFAVPMGSSYAEKESYLKFIRCLDAADKLPPGAGARIIQDLQESMARQGPW